MEDADGRDPRMMGASDRVEATRRALGTIDAFLPHSLAVPTPVEAQRAAVQRLERAGYRSAWTNEVPGKDALVQLAVLLAATEHLVFAPVSRTSGFGHHRRRTARPRSSQRPIPGRVVLGLGVGYAHQAASVGAEFDRPLAMMRRYLARMNNPDARQLPAPDVDYPRIVGANGPKMLALAAKHADGAMPAMVTPDFTTAARLALGPDKLLVVLVDVSAKQGDIAAVTATVRTHLAAGADHVVAGLPMGIDFATGVDRLKALAPALTANFSRSKSN